MVVTFVAMATGDKKITRESKMPHTAMNTVSLLPEYNKTLDLTNADRKLTSYPHLLLLQHDWAEYPYGMECTAFLYNTAHKKSVHMCKAYIFTISRTSNKDNIITKHWHQILPYFTDLLQITMRCVIYILCEVENVNCQVIILHNTY